jgi:cytochrome c oxidase cbb3-type subunit 2
MSGSIYRKPISFAVLATLVVLAGTVVTMAYPLLRPEMHPPAPAGMRPLDGLALAGRDVYQREGCVNCHTQTVRPLRSEVVRYKGNRAQVPSEQYSLAGEFIYDHPFLWGSKRTGPDLAFEGWIKPSKDWHAAHLRRPQDLVPRSNMPAYRFLEGAKLDPAEIQAHMRALRFVGVPYTDADLAAVPAAVAGKTELDGLVAYLVSLGKGVDRGGAGGGEIDLAVANPHGAGDAAAVVKGKQLFEANSCSACHGDEGHGQDGVAPSLVDDTFLGVKGDLPDAAYFAIIKGGSDAKKALGRPGIPDGGMQAYGSDLSDDDIWSIVAWLRNQKAHEATEAHPQELREHGSGAERR